MYLGKRTGSISGYRSSTVYYTTNDCSGTGYNSVSTTSIGNKTFIYPYWDRDGYIGPLGKVYTINDDRTSRTYRSYNSGSGCTSNNSSNSSYGSINMTPIATIDPSVNSSNQQIDFVLE